MPPSNYNKIIIKNINLPANEINSNNDIDYLNILYQSLTQREKQVHKLVVSGFLNKQIASRLGISEITVKVHRKRVMEKMKVRSLADLVRIAERIGIMPDYSA
ncbi:hypothetical protein WDR88_001815 [Enterobacter cloacae]|nr:hypothetical protein [Enterobacter cloacae]